MILLFIAAAASQPTSHELTIAYISNRNAQVAPCHCDSAPLGGVDRQAGAIKKLRAEKKNVLVLDGGDNFFENNVPALSKDATARAELIADALAEIRPDAIVPGERDFIRGGPFLRDLGVRARAPWVVTNIAPPADKASMVRPFLMQKFGDTRVLVLAVYTKAAFPKALADEKYKLEDPIEAVKRMLAMYKSYADLVIVIVHGEGAAEEKLASKVEGVSIVLNGHDGRLQFGARAFGAVQSLAAGNSGKYLVRVDLRWRGSLPKLEAGMEIQKAMREALKAGGPLPAALADRHTLFFQLLPIAADLPTIEALQVRAKAIDPVGYDLSPASQPH